MTRDGYSERRVAEKKFIIAFFAHYSHNFVKLQLNFYWCYMDYFNDVLAVFLWIDRGNINAVYGGSESSRISSTIS